MHAQTIDDVIRSLDDIIEWSRAQHSRLGYFPALYRKVTIQIKEGIANQYFDDGARMERLDVLFATRYLDAFETHRAGKQTTKAWQVAFEASNDWSAIVLQHLLLGINAHINLDLGIAAAQTCPGNNIKSLKRDFDTVNKILASLVSTVEDELSKVWPMLKLLDWIAGKNDEAVINFNIDIARREAWNAACQLASTDSTNVPHLIATIDEGAALLGGSVLHPGPIVGTVTNFIRIGERKSVSEIISLLGHS